MWDVRRASSSLLTLDQYNGDKTKAASETGTDGSHIFFVFCVPAFGLLNSWFVYLISIQTPFTRCLILPGEHANPHNLLECTSYV